MGIVYKQSALNTIFLFLGFIFGGINVLFLFTNFISDEYHGLITFLLSSAAILLPLIVFGMQNSVIKFYSNYSLKSDRDALLSFSLFIPLLIIIPISIFGILFYEYISVYISKTNKLIKNYTYLIFLVAIFMGYFELFYAWSKVKMQTVFGNFIKEVFHRIGVTILLLSVHYKFLTEHQFIYGVVIVYGLRMFLMLFYSLYIYTPKITFRLVKNYKEILKYALYIILSASAGGILLEIDKFMIPQIEIGIEKVAYYSVGVYIASVISIPARAMLQIATPITAKELNNNNLTEVHKLYKNSSINLLLVGGLLFLLINLNIFDLYLLIGKVKYSTGITVVLWLSFAELFKLSLGTNTAILANSKYYKIYFYFSFLMAFSVIVLNDILIKKMGANGAALSTLLVVIVYGFVRIFYIKFKMKIQPFTKKTVFTLVLIFIFFKLFSFLKFNIQPVFSILLKSIIITILYTFIIYKLKLSKEINVQIKRIYKRIL